MFFIGLVGFIVLIADIIWIMDLNKKKEDWIETEGVVIAHHRKRNSIGALEEENRDFTYAEEIQFFVNGVEKKALNSFSGSFRYFIGFRLPIIYNPNDTSEIMIKTFLGMYLIPTVVMFFALLLLWSAF